MVTDHRHISIGDGRQCMPCSANFLKRMIFLKSFNWVLFTSNNTCMLKTIQLITIMMDGWMDDLRFYILFNNISAISGRWLGGNERLCAVDPCLWLKRLQPQAGLEP